MNWASIATLVLLGMMVGMIWGYLTGREQGEKLGRDKQWMDDFFARVERDKQRREPNGQFKKKSR